MKQVIAKKNFIANDKNYIKGDIIKDLTIEQIKKLNEKGFIEPLIYEDLVIIERELNKNKEEL